MKVMRGNFISHSCVAFVDSQNLINHLTNRINTINSLLSVDQHAALRIQIFAF